MCPSWPCWIHERSSVARRSPSHTHSETHQPNFSRICLNSAALMWASRQLDFPRGSASQLGRRGLPLAVLPAARWRVMACGGSGADVPHCAVTQKPACLDLFIFYSPLPTSFCFHFHSGFVKMDLVIVLVISGVPAVLQVSSSLCCRDTSAPASPSLLLAAEVPALGCKCFFLMKMQI